MASSLVWCRCPAPYALRCFNATLAHHGVLFLDELAEFDRPALDALRQPLEEGFLTISRATGRIRYPARFQLVAAMNPCRCGYFNDPEQRCRCAADDAERYVRRVSGPFLDRVDIRIEMARVPPLELLGGPPPEGSAVVSARIAAARAVSLERNKGRSNAALTGSAVVRACALTPAVNSTLADIASTHKLSARAVHRVLRVARTIADLAGWERVMEQDILAAAALREPGASLDSSEAA